VISPEPGSLATGTNAPASTTTGPAAAVVVAPLSTIVVELP